MKERIIQAAIEEIGKYGFRKFTMESIAENLGISKKTIYKHFKNKDALISSAVDFHIELEKQSTLEAVSLPGSWIEKIKRIVSHRAHRTKYWLIPELQRFYPDEWKKIKGLSALNKEKILDLIKEGIDEGEVHPEMMKQFPIIELLLDNRLMEAVDYEFSQNNHISFMQAVEGVIEIILYGIIKREGLN
ncbi:TetR/AcrR family transcriptional regulator [Candidatus Formimonas warabiya]|uniref:HTH tetR-type domain-containing protein n=1 Tax=Formimonas warabiya TaxID=1761012 RepID=A0A3G1L089_FORW1|nr:TetR/AcrR family transcriptional regulator [Candidatus Formimonas warabiya]ATW28206.1 hypothetical protein DCMF_28695 [Candidatus Formimonas warabiya]